MSSSFHALAYYDTVTFDSAASSLCSFILTSMADFISSLSPGPISTSPMYTFTSLRLPGQCRQDVCTSFTGTFTATHGLERSLACLPAHLPTCQRLSAHIYHEIYHGAIRPRQSASISSLLVTSSSVTKQSRLLVALPQLVLYLSPPR